MISEHWQQTLLQEGENSATETKSPNFPAIFHIPATEGPVLCWAERNEPSITLRLQFRTIPAHYSYLELRFNIWTSGVDSGNATRAVLMVTSQNTNPAEVEIQQITPQDATDHPLPTWLMDQKVVNFEDLLGQGHVWRLRLPYQATPIHASNLFGKTHFGALDGKVAQIRRFFQTSQTLEIWVRGFEVSTSANTLQEAWLVEQADDPLLKWYPDQPRNPYLQIGQYPEPSRRPLYSLHSRPTFLNPLDYQTTIGYGAIYESEATEDSLNTLRSIIVPLTLLTIPGAGDRQYLGMIQLPEESTARLMPGDVVQVVFDLETNVREDDWHARVVPQFPFAHASTIGILLTRPWNRQTRQWLQLPPEIPFAPVDLLTITEPDPLRAALSHATPSQVRLLPQYSDKPFRRQIVALNHLRRHGSGSVWGLLLANHLHCLPTSDLYATIAADLSDFPARYHFNDRQAEAWWQMRQLTGGVGLMQGPPGTGKSHWLTHVLLPFVQYPNSRSENSRHQVLLTAASNQVVSDLAAKMHDLVVKEVPTRPALIVRVHAIDTEQTIARAGAYRKGSQIRPDPTARPALIEPLEDLSLLTAAMMIMRFYQDQHQQRIPGVRDARVQEYQLSLGYRMLQFAGLAQPTLGEPARYTTFLQHWNLQAEGHNFSADERQSYQAATKELMLDVLKAADVLAMTLSTAGEAWIQEHTTIHAIGVDEAAKVVEPEMWTLFAQYQPCPIILVGDIRQLNPTILSARGLNPFGMQLRVSLFSRLVMAGVPETTMTVQHRMEPTISSLISRVFYEGILEDAPAVKQPRSLTTSLKAFNQTYYRRASTLLLLDNPHGQAFSVGATRSLVNLANVAVAINLVVRLIEASVAQPHDIVILTPYHAQYNRYMSALYRLQEAKPDWKLGELLIRKVDAFQGGERPLVVLDLTVSTGVGFLREANRLNVALSRAQEGMYVIANVDGIEKAGRKRASRFVANTIAFARRQNYVIRIQTPEASHYVVDQPINQLANESTDQLINHQSSSSSIIDPTPQGLTIRLPNPEVVPSSAEQNSTVQEDWEDSEPPKPVTVEQSGW